MDDRSFAGLVSWWRSLVVWSCPSFRLGSPITAGRSHFRLLVQARGFLKASLGHDLGDAAPDGVRDLPVVLRTQSLEVLLHLPGDLHSDQDVVLLSHDPAFPSCLTKLFIGKRTDRRSITDV